MFSTIRGEGHFQFPAHKGSKRLLDDTSKDVAGTFVDNLTLVDESFDDACRRGDRRLR